MEIVIMNHLFFHDTDKIHFVRNLNPNSNGDLKIEQGDIVIYTIFFQKQIDPNVKKYSTYDVGKRISQDIL